MDARALSHRAGKLLVISQVAVSFVLLTAAVLFFESLVDLHIAARVPRGKSPHCAG